jgi:SAM-dependent methyltransferase
MSELTRGPTERFSDRVDEYIKYRPHYSPDVLEALRSACGLTPEHVVVDVGCGTGLLAEILLQNGNRLIGVEPNLEMRLAGQQYLSRFPNFRMVAGSAEETTLTNAIADFVVAGQAFHWFRPGPTRAEFARILNPKGWVVLIWHDRDTQATPFLRAYEDFLLRHSIDYRQVAHKTVAGFDVLKQFYSPCSVQYIAQHSSQQFDYDGLRGRLLSSSYAPREGMAAEAMLRELPELFSRHAKHGQVIFEYETKIYYGHLTS